MRPVGAKLLREENRRTDRREANGHFSQFGGRA